MIWYIYKHTSPNGKVYIGQTRQTLNNRWLEGDGYKHNKLFFKDIKKYGWYCFEHEVLCVCDSQAEADTQEIRFIALYDATNPKYGYNILEGGINAKMPKKEKKQPVKLTQEEKKLRKKKRKEERRKRREAEEWKQWSRYLNKFTTIKKKR